jgi:nucleotide-binding universal stress UspA family protein
VYKRVMVALDGTAGSEQVLPWVRELALREGASAVLLHVCPEPKVVVSAGKVMSFVDQEEARLRQGATGYLVKIAESLRETGVPAEVLVRFGEPAETILAAAEEVGADLIALATHGRSGFGRVVHGSVATWVVRHTDLPVLVLRREETQVA